METTPRPPGTDPVPTISIAINGVPIGNSVTLINRGFCFNNLQDFDFQTSACRDTALMARTPSRFQ
jgi:hypothetical protein